MVAERPIIIFDSGRGGQSIYQPLKVALPSAHIIYLDDHENFPYGNKSVGWLSNRFKELAKQFYLLDPQMVVLACNTATVNAIHEVRNALHCPVIGVEPVIKPLAAYTHALALMTESTAKSLRTQELLQLFGQHVHLYTPSHLAEAIEYHKNDQVKIIVHEIKKIVQEKHIEAVGLSCTHYALIRTELEDAMPGVIFIDPSAAVVKEVLRVLR